MNIIQPEFEKYIAKVYKDGTDPEQFRQLKMAFFSGASTSLLTVVESIHADRSPEVAAIKISGMLSEALKFLRSTAEAHRRTQTRTSNHH